MVYLCTDSLDITQWLEYWLKMSGIQMVGAFKYQTRCLVFNSLLLTFDDQKHLYHKIKRKGLLESKL